MANGTYRLVNSREILPTQLEEPPNAFAIPPAFVVVFVACLAHAWSVPRVWRVPRRLWGDGAHLRMLKKLGTVGGTA